MKLPELMHTKEKCTKTIQITSFLGLIVTDDSQVVQKRRKIIHQALNFHEKNFLERNLQEESSELINAIKAKQTKQKNVNDSIPMAEELSLCASNVFIRLLFNKRFPTIDGAFKTIQNLLLIMLKGLTLSNLLEGFPALRKIPLGRLLFLDEYVKGMFGFIGKEYDSHLKKKSTIDENKITDMTDILINDHNELTRDNIEVLLSDTLVAGIDATMNTLKLVVHNLAKYTDLAQTCYNEIEEVLKQNDEQKDRKITLNDVHKCHNLRAFIYESLRITTVSPLTVPHKTHAEVEVNGYIIPKDTTVFFNIHGIHQDEQVFEDPQTFNPQRFLDAENGEFKHNDRFFGFSFGRRNCIGQSYAIKSVIFVLVELMKNFELKLPDGGNLQSKFLYDTTLRVENLKVIVKER